jgi:hypothetical protein
MAVYGTTMHRQSGGFLRWLLSGGGLFLLMLIFQVYSRSQQPSPVSCAPPACVIPPPQQKPLSPPHRFTSSKYGFSLEYSTENISPAQTTATSISWDAQLNDGSEVSWTILGGSPGGKSASQIVDDVQSRNFPDAQPAYSIPGASVGYTPGTGRVYDVSIAPANGQAVHDRLVVIASIKKGLAVVVAGYGPYEQSSPHTSGHPNPAETPLVHLGDFQEAAMSVTWPGDRPL